MPLLASFFLNTWLTSLSQGRPVPRLKRDSTRAVPMPGMFTSHLIKFHFYSQKQT
jgi:hypothetical protein